MKKVNLVFCLMAIALVSYAQPSAGSLGVEVNFDPFSGNNPVFSVDGLKVRYFLSEDMAIRGTLSLLTNSNVTAAHDNDNKLFSTETISTTAFGLTPGFEYHVAKFEKGSVYAGAEIGLALGSVSTSLKHEDSNSGTDTNSEGNVFGFGVGAFTGIDYFITKNIYVGAELGLSYSSIKTTPNKTTTIGSTTESDDSYNKVSNFGFQALPTFRLGWTF